MPMIGHPEVWCKNCGHLSSRYTEYCSAMACRQIARTAGLEKLKVYYREMLSEDTNNPTLFDQAVFYAIDSVLTEE